MSHIVIDLNLERLKRQIKRCRLCKTVDEGRTRVGGVGVDCLILGE